MSLLKRCRRWLYLPFVLVLMSFLLMAEGWAAPELTSIRVKPTPEGMEVVLDVSEAPHDVNVQRKGDTQMTLSFSGRLAPGVPSSSKRFSQGNLQQVYWEQAGGKVQVFLKMDVAEAARFYPLSNPNRLVFQVKNHYSDVVHQEQNYSGLRHSRMVRSTSRGPIRVNVLEVNPRDPSLEIIPAMASIEMQGKARAETIARRNQALAAINGSYFKPDQGIPLGLLIIDEELIAGPLFERVALGITHSNQLRISRVGMRGDVVSASGQRIALDNVNQPRTHDSQVVLYTPRWGKIGPPVPKEGVQVQISNGQVSAVSMTNPLAIPEGGYVISGPRTPKLMHLASQPREAPVLISFYTIPDWSDVKHAISGGPYLVKNGQVFIDTKAQRINFAERGSYAPRTAAGITRTGNLILVTVDGRQSGSVGVSLVEMAQLMHQLGAVEAMNLDGGSSTQMVVGGRLVNTPSVPQGVAVNNCLLVRPTAEAMRRPAPLP